MSHNPKITCIHFPTSIGLAWHSVKKAKSIFHYPLWMYVLCIMSVFSLLSVFSDFLQLSRQLVTVANNLSASPGHLLGGSLTVCTSRQWGIQGRPPPPHIFRPNWGPKGRKNLLETGAPLISGSGCPPPPPPPSPPPYLKVWNGHCRQMIRPQQIILNISPFSHLI